MRYEIVYDAVLFEDEESVDRAGKWHRIEFNSYDKAMEWYNFIALNYIEVDVYLEDHEYGVTLHDGDWY